MNLRTILFGIFTFLTVTFYAQTVKSGKYEIKTGINELKYSFENLEEMNNFDWNGIKEIFKSNDENEIISLIFLYNPTTNSELDKSQTKIDNWEFKVSGKNSDIDSLINKSKKIIGKLFEISKRIKN
jgi:hypothetical protein